jgi:DNA-binding response OmpR family regulator
MKATEVFLIEDNAGDTLLIRQILAGYRHHVTVHVARDGMQALQILGDRQFKPDVIILDLSLPRLSGLELLQRYDPELTPVVIFSSSINEAEIGRAMSLGAKEFVEKPTDLQVFAEAVRGIIQRWTEKADAISGSLD